MRRFGRPIGRQHLGRRRESCQTLPVNERIELERDLYLKLLELSHIADEGIALKEALSLAVDTTGAEQGYIEIYGEQSPTAIQAIASGMDENQVELARQRVSRGIITEALTEGLIHTPSAILDDRFSERASVRQSGIESVVCAPIGTGPALGVIYLSGRARFAEADLELLKRVIRHLVPVVGRMMSVGSDPHDATAEWRAKVPASALVGRSRAMAEVLRRVSMVGSLDVPVLLTGASGTGKTLVARAIHEHSSRNGQPFVHLNCANLPEALVESELFGVEPGAFSGADRARAGKVEAAKGGTLFLDEIAELPEPAQAKLLVLLQSGRYFRLGGDREQEANVRIVTATNADLDEVVRKRTFREDLYFRINVFPIRLPSLDERIDDIPLIAQHLATAFAREQGMEEIRLSPAALFSLKTRDWPGNVRELENAVQRAVIHANAESSPMTEPHHFMDSSPMTEKADISFRQATRNFQRDLVTSTLEATNWNVQKAAQRLQIARAHLYNLIKEHGLKRP